MLRIMALSDTTHGQQHIVLTEKTTLDNARAVVERPGERRTVCANVPGSAGDQNARGRGKVEFFVCVGGAHRSEL